jgi:hypothetical protein
MFLANTGWGAGTQIDDKADVDTQPITVGGHPSLVVPGQMHGPRGPFIQTFTGKRFYLLDSGPEDVDLVDIAHALSYLCRYTGHVHTFYSVAEHSFWVAQWVAQKGGSLDAVKLALLHDATEAYVGDVAKPLKVLIEHLYAPIEDRIAQVIEMRFGLTPTAADYALVKQGDLVMLSTELKALMGYTDSLGGVGDKLPSPWDRVSTILGKEPSKVYAWFTNMAAVVGLV